MINQKRYFFVVLLAAAFQTIEAQPSSRSVTLGASGGLGIPIFNAAFRNYWNNSSSAGLESQLYLGGKVAFCPRVCYHRFGLDHERFQDDFGSAVVKSGGSLHFKRSHRNAWEMGAAFQIFFSEPQDAVDFYILMGGSYCALTYESVRGVFEKAGDAFDETLREKVTFQGYGPQAGFGLEFWMNQRLCLFSEARFHFLFTSLSPNRPGNDDEIEYVFFYDSRYLSFISILWGIRIDL